MNHAGQDLKFRVEVLFPGFSMKRDNFWIVIKNRWGQTKYIIQKDECIQDSEDRWYFTLDDVQDGTYRARLTAEVPDDDYDKMVRNVVNTQKLCSVGHCDCHDGSGACQCGGGMEVAYKQVWTVNVDGATYLADKDGNYITGNDGKRIQFPKQ